MARLRRSQNLGGAAVTEGPRVKVIGLVVGLAVLALGAGFLLMSRGQPSSEAAEHTVIPLSQRPGAKVAKPKAKPKSSTTTTQPKTSTK